ncbi:MAG: hypothetical protein SPD11_09970 [Sphaerochaetaceae bacterium]|nr:hypothetical protein [Sphaerochaetaceae bacterium]
MIVLPKRLSERFTLRDIETVKAMLDTLVKMQEEMLRYVTKTVCDFYTKYDGKQLYIDECATDNAKVHGVPKKHE